jgi:hypothetical protein
MQSQGSQLGQLIATLRVERLLIGRFSTHPAIAAPHLQPHAYGNIFNDRAKVLLGSMLGVPSRETIVAFILMSHISFANGMSILR